MTAILSPDAFDELVDFVRAQVSAGYADLPSIVAEAVEIYGPQADPEALPQLAEAAHRIASRSLTDHLQEQQSWVEPTDCDRLDAAFAELESTGIIARQHFSCCAQCGVGEIREEMDRLEQDGMTIRGFTFFHSQDTEHAMRGDWLYLSFGSRDGDRERSIDIGHEVVAALANQGLSATWNGKFAHRIGLPLTWQRRRTN